jgi:hypothetical protein
VSLPIRIDDGSFAPPESGCRDLAEYSAEHSVEKQFL